jgi:hypothetical protein
MRLSIARRKFAGRLMMGVLLIAQTIGIAQACAQPAATPAMAFSASADVQGCHHDAASANSHANPNACLQNCTAGDQFTTQVPAVFPAMPATAVLSVPMHFESTPVVARAEACELHSPDPPSSLRFCSFQL